MTKSKSKDVSESSSRKRKAGAVASSPASKSQELTVHKDAMAILNAVVEFRSKNKGSIPTPSNMEPLFRSIKGSLHEKLTSVDQLYNRFRTLKKKYRRACEEGVGPSPSDRAFYELSVKAWGEEEKLKKEKEDEKVKKKKEKVKEEKVKKEKEKTAIPMDVDDDGADEAKEEKVKKEKKKGKENEKTAIPMDVAMDVDDDGADEVKEEEVEEEKEDGDGSNSFKHLAAHASKFWPQMGLPTEILELGLQSIDKRKAAVLEKKWSAFLEVELKNMTRSHELNREIYTSLLAGLKSKRSS